jgi:hypothetical protein
MDNLTGRVQRGRFEQLSTFPFLSVLSWLVIQSSRVAANLAKPDFSESDQVTCVPHLAEIKAAEFASA